MFPIDQLIIVGGPSCSGKAYLMKKILQGDCPHLCEKVGITIDSSWLYVGARDLVHIRQAEKQINQIESRMGAGPGGDSSISQVRVHLRRKLEQASKRYGLDPSIVADPSTQPITDRLVIHYDFYAQNSQRNGFNHLNELILRAKSVTLLTLCVTPEILIQRNTSKLVNKTITMLYHPRSYRRMPRYLFSLWKKRKVYNDSSNVLSLYEKWFNFLNERSVASHWLVDPSMMPHSFSTDKIGDLLNIPVQLERQVS